MEWKKPSALVAEAELRLVEGEKRIIKQRAIIARFERANAETAQARKLLTHLIDAQHGQKLQLDRLCAGMAPNTR